ncbi:NAD-binding protein [Salinibacter altiplanensis]|uniref:NAD-binding protein n=1 Tax=Salinibacter altiplanensis TaxID=1803181 RepID=UPI001F3FB59A|nr:NAD-binding protein [Salinibacter altiplanensis]
MGYDVHYPLDDRIPRGHPLSETGRAFAFALSVTGIGIVSFVAVRSAQLLLVSDRLRERRIMKQIDELSDHHSACGHGRVGKRLTENLLQEGESVVAVDIGEDISASLSEAERLHVQGNAEEAPLRSAGIDAGDVPIVLGETDVIDALRKRVCLP